MRLCLSSIVVIAVLWAASPARGQPGPRHTPADPPAEIDRYGGLTLGVDALSIGTLLVGGMLEGPNGEDTTLSLAFFYTGLVGVITAAPLLHVTRGNGHGAAFSIGLRATVPILTATLAFATASCDGLLCELEYLGPGFLVGAGLVALVDATLLARQERPARGPVLRPVVSVGRGSCHIGVAAAF